VTARHRVCRHHPLIWATATLAVALAFVAVTLVYGTMLGQADRARWADDDTTVRVVERVETTVGVAK
jgi:hypothetical protein